MRKRILLSLVSFFMMTAMWASLIDAYQIEVSAAENGRTNGTAELTLSMLNQNPVDLWSCTLVLPEGFTFVSAEISGTRYPSNYNGTISSQVNQDGSITLTCYGANGVSLTGQTGAVATVTVAIASTVTPGTSTVIISNSSLEDSSGTTHDRGTANTFDWTIEQGGILGDLNGDGTIDISDAVAVLDLMANLEYDAAADLNGDNTIDVGDFVGVLELMAAQ